MTTEQLYSNEFKTTRLHSIVSETQIDNLTLRQISKLDKKTIIHNSRDDGYHQYTCLWWNNPNCPYAYKYLDLDSLYPIDYFQPHIGHPDFTTAKQLYDYMQQVFSTVFKKQFTNILELGCGGGEITTQFHLNNINYTAVEGTTAGKDHLIKIGIDSNRIIQSDLRKLKPLNKKFELVMCTEVAEHLEPPFASKIVELCTDHADVIWFSAAEPKFNAPHYHHPNEMFMEAWDNLFAFFGFNKFIMLNGMHGRAKRMYFKDTLAVEL